MDADRRHEAPGLETKDFIPHSLASHELHVHIGSPGP